MSGSYLGQFSNRTFTGQNKDFPRSPIPSPLSPLPSSALNDPTSGSPLIRDSRILPYHVPIDVELEGERPWRSDSGLPHPSKSIVEKSDHGEGNMDPPREGHLKGSHTSESITGADEDLDHILALLAHEDA